LRIAPAGRAAPGFLSITTNLMQNGALKALEFERVLEALHGLAITPLGAARLKELRPANDPRKVEAALAVTAEAVALVADGGRLPLGAAPEIESTLAGLAIEGRPIEPARLLSFAAFLESVERAREMVRRGGRTRFPLLHAIVDAASSFDTEIADVRRAIDPSGEVVDQASPELRLVRERLRKQRTRLRTTLESYVRGRETARYLQEQIVTERAGRYVLIVRAEHRNAIPGIVHGSSASGASLFLEPLSTVEINNDIVALEEQEREEIHRILLALSDAFRRRALELKRTIDAATELDVLQAKAELAERSGGSVPRISADGRLEIRAGRHPLLIPRVAGLLAGDGRRAVPASEPVPVDVVLVPPTTALVMTGPNTGGKTVALKMAGLLPLMAQAGLLVPAADGTRLPVFRSIFADIGDEQSIAASLSTFSWHITNIAAMDRALGLPALVLLDEVGAGTDPVEGGALAIAIIEHFRQRGALVVATTHYDMLKSYASTTNGVAVAAFGFDAETFVPTYALVYGSPGRSLALEVASRLGLPPAVVADARARRSSREQQLAEHLALMDRELAAIEQDRRLAAREREQIADGEARLRTREEALRQKEETLRQRTGDRVDDRVRDARRQIDEIVEELKRRVAALEAEAARRVSADAPALSTGDVGAARAAAREAVETVARRFEVPRLPPQDVVVAPAAGRPPALGDRVMIAALGLQGVVGALHDREAEVDVHGKRLRVPLEDLRPLAGEPERPRVSVSVHVQPREGPIDDLNVIGCSVDEALARAEKFLDDAAIAEQRTIRVIHGYGTGQLRRALASFLSGHRLVAKFSAAPPAQGGGGVTVVELKE
jgi:DNA mismatch repair protein MutS2